MAGISSLFQFMAFVFSVSGRPLSRNISKPRIKAWNDPGTCVNQSNGSSVTEWQEMSMVKGGMCRSRSMMAFEKSVPLV